MRTIKNKTIKVLRQAEKYTHTDNIYLVKNASFLTSKDLILSVLSFVMAMLFAKFLSKEIYGQYKYILSLFTLFTIASLPGIKSALVRAIAQGKEGMFIKTFQIKLRWGFLGSLVFLSIAFYYFHWAKNTNFSIIFVLAAFILPFVEAMKIYLLFLEGKKLFHKEAIYQTISQIIISAAIAATIFLTNNILFIVVVFLASSVLLNFVFFILTLKKFKSNNKRDSETIKYGKELSFFNVFYVIGNELDKILLFNFIGPAGLAVYSFATLPIRQLTSLLKNIRLIAYPKFANQPLEEIKKSIFKKIFLLMLGVISIIIIYIMAVPYFFKIFFPEYSQSIFYSRLFVLTLLTFPTSILSSILYAHMLKKEVYSLHIIYHISNFLLLFFFIFYWGLLGAIIARVVHSILSASLTYLVFQGKMKSLDKT